MQVIRNSLAASLGQARSREARGQTSSGDTLMSTIFGEDALADALNSLSERRRRLAMLLREVGQRSATHDQQIQLSDLTHQRVRIEQQSRLAFRAYAALDFRFLLDLFHFTILDREAYAQFAVTAL